MMPMGTCSIDRPRSRIRHRPVHRKQDLMAKRFSLATHCPSTPPPPRPAEAQVHQFGEGKSNFGDRKARVGKQEVWLGNR